jgi:hypothetical protein
MGEYYRWDDGRTEHLNREKTQTALNTMPRHWVKTGRRLTGPIVEHDRREPGASPEFTAAGNAPGHRQNRPYKP